MWTTCVSITKEYNLRRHFKTDHSDFNQKYSMGFGNKKVDFCRSNTEVQENIFKTCSNTSEKTIEVSFDICHLIVKAYRPLNVDDL
jgi:hypothetical protein